MPAPASTGARAPRVLSTADVSPPEQYFRGVSPLCRRLLDDMRAVRESWGDTWDGLSYQQQCRVLDQAIVDEATVRRYDCGGEDGPECEYFPKLKLTTGQKVVCDENLTARGFSCSWRDEHSAPFSWHTRSQMDLTLETPPPTPTHATTPVEASPSAVSGQGRVIPGGRAVYSARPVSMPRPPRFRWHYDPPDPPDPPAVVVAAPRSCTLPQESATASPSRYAVVRGKGEAGGEGGGLLARLRGAVAALTATCLPLRPAPGPTTSLLSLQRAADGGEPDLRTPDRRSLVTQPREVCSNSSRPGGAGDVSLSTTRTSLGTGDGRSDEAEGSSGVLQPPCPPPDPTLGGYVCAVADDEDDAPYKPAPLPPPHPVTPTGLPTPLPTPTTADLNVPIALVSTSAAPAPDARPPSDTPDHTSLSAISEPDSTSDGLDTPREEQPLLRRPRQKDASFISVLACNRESNIPKTGFDFLDNW